MSAISDMSGALQALSEHNPRILIVDDNEVNRSLLGRMIESEGFEAVLAHDGHDALAKLDAETVDLVLLDIMMPGIDGLQVLEQIRENETTKSLPVILISAMADTRDIVRGLSRGANDYITKPVDVSITLARVKSQIALKLLLDERAQTIEQLRQTQAMRDHFFRIASHDLKGPLTNLNMAHLLLREMLPDREANVTNVLDTIQVTVRSMMEVVEEFLETAMLHHGRIELNIRPENAADVIQRVVVQHEAIATQKGIRLDVSPTHEAILCDPVRLQQILANLVSNAIKYSPKQATVSISTRVTPDNALRIAVQDQGAGIPEAEREQLFQPFSKLSTRPTGGESSHGLGLWIAQELTTLQNGRIGHTPATDCPDAPCGSIFWIELPRP